MNCKNIHRFFFFLLLVCAPIQLNTYFWPEWSLVLGRKIDLLAPSLYFTDFLLLGTVVFWIINTYKTIYLKKYTLVVFAGLALITLNTFASNTPALTIAAWIQAIKFTLLTLYVVSTSPSLFFVARGLAIGALGSVCVGVLQVLGQQSLGGVFYFFGERTLSVNTPGVAKAVLCAPELLGSFCYTFLRAYATFPHPNVFAGYLVFVLSTIWAQSKHSKAQYLFSVVVLIGLLLTFSRSALFGLGAAWLWSRKKIFAALFCSIVFFLTLPSSFSFFEGKDSFSIRQDLLSASLQMIETNPLFGVGLKQFIPSLPPHLIRREIYVLQPVHNTYVLLITELGVVGVCLLLYIVIRSFKIMNYSINTTRLSIILPLLAIGILDHYLLTLHQGLLLLALSLGLIVQKNSILKQ